MNQRICSALFVAALAASLVTGDVSAQTAVNGPYYATPSWDQTLPVASRFLVLANFNAQAVLDRETGLVWEQAPPAITQPYPNAFADCNSVAIGRRLGWRLPSMSELGTLLDPLATSAPALPAGHPFTMPSGGASFWSTTPSIVVSARPTRYVTTYNAAGLIGSGFVAESAPIGRWCVRGPGDPVGTHF